MVPGHRNKAGPIIVAGGESCLQSVKTVTSVKHNKTKCNETRSACISPHRTYILIDTNQ